ncbi:recombinase family protein [Rubripirellula obstinata]|nr:recombinase family protein [Rubripirellula obstinata]
MACYTIGLDGELQQSSLYCTTQYAATLMSFSLFVKKGDESEAERGSMCDTVTAIYARQSRRRGQAYSSCENQIDLCRSLASQRKWLVTHVFSDEGQSSETLDRPQLSRLVAEVEAGKINRLVVYSIDRLSRRLADFGRLLQLFEKHNVELVVVTDPNYSDTAAGRLMTNIVAAASEFQQDLTRERMADMRSAYKRVGKRVAGRVPFGYRAESVTKQLVVDPVQSVAVRDFFALASKGSRPSELAGLANQSHWKDQNGNVGKWTPRRILKLLSNRVYVGEIPDGDSTLPGAHQAIVSVAAFDAVQRELISRRTQQSPRGERRARGGHKHAGLLGLLVCGGCHRPMSTSISHRGPVRYLYYRCRSNAGGVAPCPGVNIGVYELERFVCTVITDVEDISSEIPLELREHWKQIDQRQLQTDLPRIVEKVIYHHGSGELTIELDDDRLHSLAAGLTESPERTDSESL